jgi:hypothetical protein
MRSEGLFDRPIPPGIVWILATLAATVLGHWLQSSAHLNHDVSWIAHSARWLLEGRRFGIDVIDVNPPMIWWLSLPAALLVKMQVASEPLAVRLVFWAYFGVSAALLFGVLSHLERRERAASIGWRVSFIVVATLAPAASFGQREYVSVLFAMPYLAAAALRLQGTTGLSRMVYAAVGLLAGIGFAFKPYFLAVPLLVEALVIARLGWRSLFRIENLILGLTLVAYALLIVILVPQYLEFTLPLLRTIYWAFDTADFAVVLARYRAASEPFIYGALITLLARRWTRQHSVLLLGGAGYSVSYFIQSKGFVYHAFPVLMCAYAFLGVSLASGLGHVWNDRQTVTRPLRFALVSSMLLLTLPPIKLTHDATVDWYVQYNTTWGRTGRYREAIIALVNQHAPTRQSYFMAFSTHLYPGFPTASYTKADWSSRSATQGIVAAYARRDELADPVLKKKVVSAANLQRHMVIEDFELRPPSIVFAERQRLRFGMNGRQFDDLAFYQEDPRFKRIWSNYAEQAPIGPLRVFIRRADATGNK